MLIRQRFTMIVPVGLMAIVAFSGCSGHRHHRQCGNNCGPCSQGVVYYQTQPQHLHASPAVSPAPHDSGDYETIRQYSVPSNGPNVPSSRPEMPPAAPPAFPPAPPMPTEASLRAIRKSTPRQSYRKFNQYSVSRSSDATYDPITVPIETERKLVPRATKSHGLFRRAGNGIRSVFTPLAKRRQHDRIAYIESHAVKSNTSSSGIKTPVQPIRLSLRRPSRTDFTGKELIQDRGLSADNGSKRNALENQVKSTSPEDWGTHFPRQATPSTQDSPLMRVPQPSAQIELWPYHTNKSAANANAL